MQHAQHTFGPKLNAENMNKSLMYTKHLFMFPTLEQKWDGVLLLRLLGVRHLLHAPYPHPAGALHYLREAFGDFPRGPRATRSRCRGGPEKQVNER